MRASSMSTSARAAKVDQVLVPRISQSPSAVRPAATAIPATSDPKSGSVTATPAMISPVASLGSHVLLLDLGPAPQQGPGQDLGPGDERAAGPERGPG